MRQTPHEQYLGAKSDKCKNSMLILNGARQVATFLQQTRKRTTWADRRYCGLINDMRVLTVLCSAFTRQESMSDMRNTPDQKRFWVARMESAR